MMGNGTRALNVFNCHSVDFQQLKSDYPKNLSFISTMFITIFFVLIQITLISNGHL